jgi:hypothetical protein
MANYIETYKSKLDWANTFNRTGDFPLDRSSMFSSYDDAVIYANGGQDSRGLSGVSYVGQIITVYENGKVDVYKIGENRNLEHISDEDDIADIINSMPIGEGDVKNSAVLKGGNQGYKNKAISQTSMAVGAATTAGLKGWYYSAIDFTNKKITLSDKPTYILAGSILLGGSWLSGIPNIKVNDVISLVNNSKYDFCSKVTAVNGNVITVDSLPFTGLVRDGGAAVAVQAGQFSDGYSIYIPDKPDAGLVDFGGGAFSEGGQSKATNVAAHAEGFQTHAYGQFSHAEGRDTEAGYAAHAEGRDTKASGAMSHAEGSETTASGWQAHAEGKGTLASGNISHAEGQDSKATNNCAHAEGVSTEATGIGSHSEGSNTKATTWQAHAEGNRTEANGNASHAEGNTTIASGNHSHAEGSGTHASGWQAHAEGYNTLAKGNRTHAEGSETEAFNLGEHAQGSFNKSTESADKSKATQFSIGIGTSATDRKNAVEVKANGDVYIIGVGGYDGINSDSAQTLQEILANL